MIKYYLYFTIAIILGPIAGIGQYNCQETKLLRSGNLAIPSINNNAKSDTFDITHYGITLDLTAIGQQNFQARADVHFSPKIPGVTTLNLDLHELTIDSIFLLQNGAIVPNSFNYTYNDSVLALSLNQALNLTDSAVFRIYYSGYPKTDQSGWGGFIASSGYYYNLGVGFAANPHTFGRAWFPCYDNFVEKSTYSISVKSRLPLQPLISGDQINRQTLNGDTILSSSSLQEPIPTYLVSFALANYQFINDTVQGQNGVKDILLAVKPADSAKIVNSFKNLKPVFHAFENYFGPYEWPRIGYAATTVGAMEHATSIHYPINLIDGTLDGEDIMAHELAHHWFGNLVTCETAEDMWINEGMAEFCSHLYREAVYGEADYNATVRDNAYNVLNFAHNRDNGYRPIYGPPNEYTYGYHTYQKGAMVAHNLRHYLGDTAFFNGLQSLLQQNKYGNLNTAQFRDQLQQITGNNTLQDFFNDWIYAPGFPQFSVEEWEYQPLIQRLNFTLKQRLYQASALYSNVPVDVTIFGQNGQQLTMNFQHSGLSSQHQGILMPFEPVAVLASYGGNLLTASTYDHFQIADGSSQSGQYSELDISVDNFQDSGSVIALHHLAPSEKKAINGFDFKLSSTRYWTIQKLGLGNTELSATLRFDGSNRGWDQNLLANGNDSLVVLYRASGSEMWNIYPHQQKNVGSPNSRVGSITLQQLKSGDYVLANTAESIGINDKDLAHQAIEIYPNPSADKFTVIIPRSGKDSVQLEIQDLGGKILESRVVKTNKERHKLEISLKKYPAGTYLLVINGNSYKIQRKGQ